MLWAALILPLFFALRDETFLTHLQMIYIRCDIRITAAVSPVPLEALSEANLIPEYAAAKVVMIMNPVEGLTCLRLEIKPNWLLEVIQFLR